MRSVTAWEQPFGMAGQEVVAKLVSTVKRIKPSFLHVQGVADAEHIANGIRNPDTPGFPDCFGLDVDVMPPGDLERADRESGETAILRHLLCRVFRFEAGNLFGHGQLPLLTAAVLFGQRLRT